MGINLEKGVWSTGLGMAGGGAVVIMPAQIWVGYCLLAASATLFIWGVRINGRHLWQRWWRPLEPAPEQPDQPIPFVSLRQIAQELGITLTRYGAEQNNGYAMEGALKEAAANGKLLVWGRPYQGPIRDNDPLVLIPKEHFITYSFRHGALDSEVKNDQTATGTMGMLAKGVAGIQGVTFYDLHLANEASRDVLRAFGEGLKNGND